VGAVAVGMVDGTTAGTPGNVTATAPAADLTPPGWCKIIYRTVKHIIIKSVH
jgi:hypothetical protein